MKVELIIKLEKLIESLNSKQQSIARGIVSNPNYKIIEIDNEILISDKSNTISNFKNFIKSQCNCD